MLPTLTKEERKQLGYLARQFRLDCGMEHQEMAREIRKRERILLGRVGRTDSPKWEQLDLETHGRGFTFLPFLVVMMEMGMLPRTYEELRKVVVNVVQSTAEGLLPDNPRRRVGARKRLLKRNPQG